MVSVKNQNGVFNSNDVLSYLKWCFELFIFAVFKRDRQTDRQKWTVQIIKLRLRLLCYVRARAAANKLPWRLEYRTLLVRNKNTGIVPTYVPSSGGRIVLAHYLEVSLLLQKVVLWKNHKGYSGLCDLFKRGRHDLSEEVFNK